MNLELSVFKKRNQKSQLMTVKNIYTVRGTDSHKSSEVTISALKNSEIKQDLQAMNNSLNELESLIGQVSHLNSELYTILKK